MFDYKKLYAGRQVCCTCASFVQHYRKDLYNGEVRYLTISCGHCMKQRRPKRYPPDAPACGLWEKA